MYLQAFCGGAGIEHSEIIARSAKTKLMQKFFTVMNVLQSLIMIYVMDISGKVRKLFCFVTLLSQRKVCIFR